METNRRLSRGIARAATAAGVKPGVGLAIPLAFAVWLAPVQLSATTAHAAGPTARVLALLNAGKRPEPVLADPAHHRVYVGTETGGSVTVVDDRTNHIVRTIHVGREVEDLALDGATGMLYAASSVRSRLSVINTSTLRIVAVVNQLKHASGVALDPSRHRLYVTETNAVATIDTVNDTVIHQQPLAGGPLGVGVDSTLHRVFVGLFKLHRVDVLDASSNRIIGSVRVGNRSVHPFRVDSSNDRLYVLNSGSSTLSIIDTQRLRVIRTIGTGKNPEGIDVWPARNRVYISNEGDPGTDKNSGHTASVIDLRTGRIIDTLSVLQGPDGIAYDSNTGSIYVANENPGRVLVMRLPLHDR